MAAVSAWEIVNREEKVVLTYQGSKTYSCIFSSCLIDIWILSGIGEAPVSSDDNVVWILAEESRLNSILMLCDCTGERLSLQILLRFCSCKLVIGPLDFAAKYCCSVVLHKNGSLGHFYSLLVVDWFCSMFTTVKEVA